MIDYSETGGTATAISLAPAGADVVVVVVVWVNREPKNTPVTKPKGSESISSRRDSGFVILSSSDFSVVRREPSLSAIKRVVFFRNIWCKPRTIEPLILLNILCVNFSWFYYYYLPELRLTDGAVKTPWVPKSPINAEQQTRKGK